jgi:hypothetical protein
MPPKAVDHEVVVHEVPEVLDLATTDIPIPDDVRYPSEFGLDDLDDEWSADEAVGESFLASTSVDKMLSSSVKPATARKYSRIWDKWVAFAASHGVEIMPPDVRALEIFRCGLRRTFGFIWRCLNCGSRHGPLQRLAGIRVAQRVSALG